MLLGNIAAHLLRNIATLLAGNLVRDSVTLLSWYTGALLARNIGTLLAGDI